jgi:hypothetical protein
MKKFHPLIYILATAIIVGVVAGGGGFYFGKKTALNSFQQGMGNFRGNFAAGRNGTPMGNARVMQFNGRGAIGEVSAIDDKSLTLKLPDGSSKIVITSDTTRYETTQTTQKSEVTTGKNIRVLGPQNSDGSITAESIMINPQSFGASSSAQPVQSTENK